VNLPLVGNVLGFGAFPVGGATGFYVLDEDADHPLSFRVWGYFNLRGCELTDDSGSVFHPPLLLWNPKTGELRSETNEEAALHDLQ
jgi:hypothetical protein